MFPCSRSAQRFLEEPTWLTRSVKIAGWDSWYIHALKDFIHERKRDRTTISRQEHLKRLSPDWVCSLRARLLRNCVWLNAWLLVTLKTSGLAVHCVNFSGVSFSQEQQVNLSVSSKYYKLNNWDLYSSCLLKFDLWCVVISIMFLWKEGYWMAKI